MFYVSVKVLLKSIKDMNLSRLIQERCANIAKKQDEWLKYADKFGQSLALGGRKTH